MDDSSPADAPSGALPRRAPTRVPQEAREHVADALTRHFAEDRLEEGDLEARLDRVYAARTLEELAAVIADLPSLAQDAAATAAAPMDTRSVPEHLPERVTAIFSGQEQRLSGVVPRRLRVRARFGYVELDLTRATFEPGLTEIDVRSFMGYVQVTLPAGVRVESVGHGLFGFFALKGAHAAEVDSATVVRITGRAVFGFAEGFVTSARAGADRRLGPGDGS
jgi:DUF1707 SHOCT-like domain